MTSFKDWADSVKRISGYEPTREICYEHGRRELRDLLDAQGDIVEDMRKAMQYATDELEHIPARIKTYRVHRVIAHLNKVLEPQS